jgi:DNA-binding GntR family transcriptional regulator
MTNSTGLRLRDHAYSNFTEKLLADHIHPGEIVSQRELVELTGMPLGAIREMIPRLEADGLIKTVPKRGLQVLTVDLELVRNAFQVRHVIEGEAIAEFCKVATTEEIARLAKQHQDVLDAANEAVSPELLQTAQQIDWAFHDRIIDAMGNAIISDIHRVNAIKIRLIRSSDTRMLPELVVPVLIEHLAIFAALKERDSAKAVIAIHAHINSAKRRALGM